MDERSAGPDQERAILELRPPPFAIPAVWVGGVCLGVAAVGTLVPDLFGDALPSSWASLLRKIGLGAAGLGLLAMAAGALWRPRRGTRIEFLSEHLELPRLGSPTRRTRIPYTEVTGVHPWSPFPIRALVLGCRGRSPRFFRARSFVAPDAIPTFVARVRAGVSALPNAETTLRLLDRRAAAADAISNGR